MIKDERLNRTFVHFLKAAKRTRSKATIEEFAIMQQRTDDNDQKKCSPTREAKQKTKRKKNKNKRTHTHAHTHKKKLKIKIKRDTTILTIKNI